MDSSEIVQIADILPPPVPDAPAADFWIYVVLFAVIIITAGFRYLRSSQQRLKRLRKQYRQRKLDKRRCAFQLSHLLCQHMQIVSSGAAASLRLQKNKTWQEYLTALQRACYSREGLSDDAMVQLLNDTERWLQ